MLRRLLLLCCVVCPLLLAGCGRETTAERAANDYAARELAAAPTHTNLPDYSLPADKLAKAVLLETVRTSMALADDVWGIVQLVLLLWLGAVAWMRDKALSAGRNRWLQGLVFVVLFVGVTFLLNLPLAAFQHHLSVRYGLSIQGWGSWFADKGKSLLISLFVLDLLTMLLFFIIRKAPRRWWMVFWAASIPIALFGVFITPQVEKLFNKFEPLQLHHPELVAQLERVAERGHMNIPPERMFLMQASAKVTTINAYVTGFGASKRVVVWDTSLSKGTPDEILFIFGHESGHYVLGHLAQGIAMTLAVLLVLLYVGYRFVQWAIARFGGRWGVPAQEDWSALAVLLLAFSIFSMLLQPLSATISRDREHAADVYGQEAIHGIVADPQTTVKNAFHVLGESVLEDPNPNRFVEFWEYDHPATGRRAAFGAAYDPWAGRMQPKYFGK